MFELTDDLLVKILLFIVTFSLSSFLLKRILKDKITPIVIAMCISLLAVFYASYSQWNFLYLTYSATGIILLIFIPFIIVFFFIYSSNISGVIRKMLWVFYSIVSVFVFGKNEFLSPESTTNYILLIILLAVVIILFDNLIKTIFNTRKNLKIRRT